MFPAQALVVFRCPYVYRYATMVKAQGKKAKEATPKVKKGQSIKERSEVTDVVNQKCKDFANHIKKNSIEKPDKETLLKFFDKSTLITLWKRFESARGKKGLSVQQAWDDIIKEGQKKPEDKRYECLGIFISGAPDNTWTSRIITVSEEISEIKKAGSKGKVYYKGELEQIHGIDEATDFINRGKYEKVTDEEGDAVCFINQTKQALKQNKNIYVYRYKYTKIFNTRC